uniref:TrbL/VirB6 plasmid conjugal transfer protein n=1 Tax=Amycolatopsis sp. SANK 60206 TaxID=1642649 RepID=A0A0E3Z7G9_9PSEU|nr:hypothetical protein [Amycolatopsis sp. SANK 60206]
MIPHITNLVAPTLLPMHSRTKTRRPRRRWLRSAPVLLVLVAALGGMAARAEAATARPVDAAPAFAPAQPPPPAPPIPLPTTDPCEPGSTDPVCTLPGPPPAPPTGLPSTPLVPVPAPPAPPSASCFPGAITSECTPPGPPTSAPPPSCDGPDCIPQPVPLYPTPGQSPGPAAGDDDQSDDCGLTDLRACVTEALGSFFRGVVTDALNPLLDLLGKTLLATPDPASVPGLAQLWTESWQILLAVYGIVVLLAGLILMSYQTLQARYSVKEIAPRLAVGFLAGTLSLFIAGKAISLANGLAQAVMGQGVDPEAASKALTDMVLKTLQGGGLWLIFIGLGLLVMIVVLLITFIVRAMLTILLIAAAPVILMWHALPHTEGIARTWWKAFGGLLAIQLGQSLALATAMRVFFAPGGFTQFGPSASGLINLLMCLGLVWVLIKIPFWCLAPVRGSGRSLFGSLARGLLAYKTMGLLGGANSLLGGGGRGPRSSDERPLADPPATPTGQFMLPMTLRRHRPAPRSPRLSDVLDAPRGTDRRHGPGQQSLFTASKPGGARRTVAVNPRAVPPNPLPGALPADQLGFPITTRRDPDATGRRSLAEELAERGDRLPPPVAQPGLITEDGRINRNARPLAQVPNALIAPESGMLPLHLRPSLARTPRRTVADDLAAPAPPPTQTGPALITPSGRINRAARATRRHPRDAYTGNRPMASGQYPLPLGVRRGSTPTPPADAPAPPSPAPTPSTAPSGPASGAPVPRKRVGIQLPLDLPLRRGPKKK